VDLTHLTHLATKELDKTTSGPLVATLVHRLEIQISEDQPVLVKTLCPLWNSQILESLL